MSFNIGDKVTITKCVACPKVVGKTVEVTGTREVAGKDCVVVKFGRGRPQANRPDAFDLEDISVIEGGS